MPKRFPHVLTTCLALTGLLLLPSAVQAHGRGGQGPLGHQHGQPIHRVVRHLRTLTGRVVSINDTATPVSLTLRAGNRALVTISVSSTTRFLRRYGGASTFDEILVGDHLSVWGSFEAGGRSAFDALRIQNLSIQRAWVRVEGRVASVTADGAFLSFHGSGRFQRNHITAITFSPTVVVMSGPATTTVAAIQPGMHILVLGLYDRKARVVHAERIRILQAPVPQPTSTPVAATATLTATATLIPTATLTATATMTPTATVALTATATITPTDTPVITATATMTSTVAPTATITGTTTAP